MKFGFSLVVRGNDATPDTFAAIAERAEALALDSLARTPSTGRSATGSRSRC
jgi:hypothetical protein